MTFWVGFGLGALCVFFTVVVLMAKANGDD